MKSLQSEDDVTSNLKIVPIRKTLILLTLGSQSHLYPSTAKKKFLFCNNINFRKKLSLTYLKFIHIRDKLKISCLSILDSDQVFECCHYFLDYLL